MLTFIISSTAGWISIVSGTLSAILLTFGSLWPNKQAPKITVRILVVCAFVAVLKAGADASEKLESLATAGPEIGPFGAVIRSDRSWQLDVSYENNPDFGFTVELVPQSPQTSRLDLHVTLRSPKGLNKSTIPRPITVESWEHQ